jgi:ribonuclease R
VALPSPAQILAFLKETPMPAGKREIARAFGLTGAEKIELKALLRRMEAEGQLGRDSARAFHRGDGLPRVAVVRVVDIGADGAPIAVPDRWDHGGPPPRLRVVEGARRGALGVGDRVLARIEEVGRGWRAHSMKKLERAEASLLGVLRRDGPGRFRLEPVDKRARFDVPVSDPGEARPGELVLAEAQGRPPRLSARVTQVLGDPFAPRAFSLIAIHRHGIPLDFPAEAEAEAAASGAAPLGPRSDLTHLPFLTIDPEDARDHDDAVWAAPDEDPANPGGWRLAVAIADVSWFVRPGSALDRAARERGNSVYFPDRVVPMLPHALSSEACSLKAGTRKAALICWLTIGTKGGVRAVRFERAAIRVAANLTYEAAQAQADAGAGEHWARLAPLWGTWRALEVARDRREPLELDLPERRVVLDAAGRIAQLGVRERLDAHRLIEDMMVAANVAAARTLESRRSPVIYRVHEAPSREKLVALKDYLATLGLPFALGQLVTPAMFNRVLAQVKGRSIAGQVAEQVLRSQAQAVYAPANAGHFGLALASYAHFTSPIRRYADLLVHRLLVRALRLGEGGERDPLDEAGLARTTEHISMTERRAMEAERETLDRYVAAHLAGRVGETVEARITGVARFGLFAQVEGVGGDGILPMGALGEERFHLDEAARTLEGLMSGTRFTVGQRLKLRLAEANPVTGGLRFELPLEAGLAGAPAGRRRDRTRPRAGRR